MSEPERDLTIKEFCELHLACEDGREWALANCSSMQDCWEKLPGDWLIWVATRDGVLPAKELRLFAVFCARQIWHLLTDERSRKAVEVAEKFAHGQATDEELATARHAAMAAARDVARESAAVAWAAAKAKAADAAAVAWAAAKAKAVDAVGYAAWAAAWTAAEDAARDIQAAWLRANTKPNFKRRSYGPVNAAVNLA